MAGHRSHVHFERHPRHHLLQLAKLVHHHPLHRDPWVQPRVLWGETTCWCHRCHRWHRWHWCLLRWGGRPEFMLPMGKVAGLAFSATPCVPILVAQTCCLKIWLFTQLTLRVCKWTPYAIEALAWAPVPAMKQSQSLTSCSGNSRNPLKLDDGWPESVEEQGLLLLVWRRNFRNDLWKMCYRQSRRGVSRQDSKKCKTIVCIADTLLHTYTFTHKSF